MADPLRIQEVAREMELRRRQAMGQPYELGGVEMVPTAGDFDPRRGFASHETNQFGEVVPIPNVLPVRRSTEQEREDRLERWTQPRTTAGGARTGQRGNFAPEPTFLQRTAADFTLTEPRASRLFPADIGVGAPAKAGVAAVGGPFAGARGGFDAAEQGLRRAFRLDPGAEAATPGGLRYTPPDQRREFGPDRQYVSNTSRYRIGKGHFGGIARHGEAYNPAAAPRRDVGGAEEFDTSFGQYLAPSEHFKGVMEEYGGSAPGLYELNRFGGEGPKSFVDAARKAQESRGVMGRSVTVANPEDYAGHKMFLSEDRSSGFAVSPSGELTSVFSAAGSPNKAFSASILPIAVSRGARWLNAFDTALPEMYARFGFRPVARIPFDESVARADWGDEATDAFIADMAARGHHGTAGEGRPDLVFMGYDPEFKGRAGRGGQMVGSWDEAEAMAKELGHQTPLDLPMDYESRMKRAVELGFDIDQPWYHGTLRNVEEFRDPRAAGASTREDAELGSATYHSSSYHGPGAYLTDSPYDASRNYADIRGPDPRNKISSQADAMHDLEPYQLGDELLQMDSSRWARLDDPELEALLHRAMGDPRSLRDPGQGVLPGMEEGLMEMDTARAASGREQALEDLDTYIEQIYEEGGGYRDLTEKIAEVQQTEHGGMVMPVLTRAKNPTNVSALERGRSDFHEMRPVFDDAHEDIIDFEGPGKDLIDAVGDALDDMGADPWHIDAVKNDLLNKAMESEGLSTYDLEAYLRRGPVDFLYDLDMGPGELMQNIYTRMGHDAIDFNDPGYAFGMRPIGNVHRVVMDPTLMRSPFARFDPRDINSADLMAARADPTAALAASTVGGGGGMAQGGDGSQGGAPGPAGGNDDLAQQIMLYLQQHGGRPRQLGREWN